MKGFLSLEPDEGTHARLATVQNRLRDALTRQGVHFPDRMGVLLLAWPFADRDQLFEAAVRLKEIVVPIVDLRPLGARPNADRPAEIGFDAEGLRPLQDRLFDALRDPLDPDPPKDAFVRLARVSPPSRKVGAALRGAGALGLSVDEFSPVALTIWHQTPTGYETYRTMPVANGGR